MVTLIRRRKEVRLKILTSSLLQPGAGAYECVELNWVHGMQGLVLQVLFPDLQQIMNLSPHLQTK